MRMRFLFLPVLGTATAVLATPAVAAERVLDFTQGFYCRGGQLCTNNGAIDQIYGDSAQLDITYSTKRDGAVIGPAYYYELGFGDLAYLLYAGIGTQTDRGEITFNAAAGFEISLLSFDVGCFVGAASCRTFDYNVFGNGASVATGGGSTNYPLHTAVNTSTGYFNQIAFNFGAGENVGIDNIRLDVRAITQTPSVPEPATWAMMIGGFGMVGGAMRRQRRTAVLA